MEFVGKVVKESFTVEARACKVILLNLPENLANQSATIVLLKNKQVAFEAGTLISYGDKKYPETKCP